MVARQHYERELSVTPNLGQAIRYLLAVLEAMPDVVPDIFQRPDSPVVIYTDASAEGSRVRIGGIIFEVGRRPAIFAHDVSEQTRPLLGEGDTVINQAELLAAPLLVYSAPARLKGKDVIWFLDNTSAETALVKAGGPTETMCFLALIAGAALGGLGAAVWYDHVGTNDNPADVLSRAGLEDPAVLSNVERGVWDVVKVVEPDVTTLEFHRLWQCRA